MAALIDLIDMEGEAGNLIRALRQGIYFGLETRVPYAVANVLRPYMFGKSNPNRPWFGQLKFYAEQSISHGWIIARISVIYKLVESTLAKLTSGGKIEQWQSFVAGCVCGYLVMVRDGTEGTLKKQINMAIGIRTLYALGAYLIRQGKVPFLNNNPAGYERGSAIYITLMWGAVMWHWRHQTTLAPNEMNPAQVASMDFIYDAGDKIGRQGWLGNYYLMWLAFCVLIQRF